MDEAHSKPVDPVTTEIVRNCLIAVTEEMKTNLMRAAYNMIIYEALDFTVGPFDARGNTLSIGPGLPMFIRGMSDTVKAKIAHFGLEKLEPGDILLINDAYTTGGHLSHMTFFVPIFDRGEVVAFSTCVADWAMSAARCRVRPPTSIPEAGRCRSRRPMAKARPTRRSFRSSG